MDHYLEEETIFRLLIDAMPTPAMQTSQPATTTEHIKTASKATLNSQGPSATTISRWWSTRSTGWYGDDDKPKSLLIQ